jgi:hypothetical protein
VKTLVGSFDKYSFKILGAVLSKKRRHLPDNSETSG